MLKLNFLVVILYKFYEYFEIIIRIDSNSNEALFESLVI